MVFEVDKGKVTRAGINERLKQWRVESGELRVGDDDAEEQAALKQCLELMEAEIKSLAIDDKWFAAIRTAIEGEVQRITQRLPEDANIFAAKYQLYLPSKQELKLELEKIQRELGDGESVP